MRHLILFLLPSVLIAGCKSGEQPEAKPVATVFVQAAATSNVPLLVSAPATVFGKNEAHIPPRIRATVQQMLVHQGETVRKGQVLAVLDQHDLTAQRTDAVAGVESAQAALQKTQSGSIPSDLTQAQGDLNAKRAALELANKVLARRQQLLAECAISERELETSRAQQAQAQADYDASQKNFDVLGQHTSADELRMAQSALAQSKAREALADANLGFTVLRSPFDGTVTEQTAFAGDLASPGTPLLTVDDLSSAVARAQVDADESGPVKTGQACSFALDHGDTTDHFGRVIAVNQAVDPARRTIEVWCEIPNRDREVKAGLFGAVHIRVGMAANSVVLPASAVEFQEGTTKGEVYVVDAHHVAHVRAVVAQPLTGDRVRIISGIRPGEMVITSGEYGIPDGTEVKTAGAA